MTILTWNQSWQRNSFSSVKSKLNSFRVKMNLFQAGFLKLSVFHLPFLHQSWANIDVRFELTSEIKPELSALIWCNDTMWANLNTHLSKSIWMVQSREISSTWSRLWNINYSTTFDTKMSNSKETARIEEFSSYLSPCNC